jgi:hypothetical protein
LSNSRPPTGPSLSHVAIQNLKIGIALVLPLLIAAVIAGCGDQPTSGTGSSAVVHVTATVAPSQRVPDPQEVVETAATGVTPQFLVNTKFDKDKSIVRYAFAAAHKDDLAQIPCFCGCALYEHAHTSLQSCYMKMVNADGSIVYTDHSVTCDTCTGEVDMMMKLAGTPLKEIRAQIEKKYNYTGVWTDTPPIQ